MASVALADRVVLAAALAVVIPAAAAPDEVASAVAAALAAVIPAAAVPDEDNTAASRRITEKNWARCELTRSVPIVVMS